MSTKKRKKKKLNYDKNKIRVLLRVTLISQLKIILFISISLEL
jgi:hypothetical protein